MYRIRFFCAYGDVTALALHSRADCTALPARSRHCLKSTFIPVHQFFVCSNTISMLAKGTKPRSPKTSLFKKRFWSPQHSAIAAGWNRIFSAASFPCYIFLRTYIETVLFGTLQSNFMLAYLSPDARWRIVMAILNPGSSTFLYRVSFLVSEWRSLSRSSSNGSGGTLRWLKELAGSSYRSSVIVISVL